jgi:hypothetical protein
MTVTESEKGDVAEPGLIASGASYSNRIRPRVTGPVVGAVVAGETTIVFHGDTGDEPAFGPPEYTRSNAIICEASLILEGWKYLPATVRKCPVPIDIIAVGPDDTLVIEVVRARKPVPDAKVLCTIYRKEVDHLRSMKASSQFRKMLWVCSPRCGWRFYDVFPGGVWLAKDLMEADRP